MCPGSCWSCLLYTSVQFPVGIDKNGVPCIGFYAGRTHRIVPCPDCKLQPLSLIHISSFALCQNVYCTADVWHQGLSVALALSQSILRCV